MRIRVLLGTLVMLMAMMAVPTAMAANTFYLVPQDSTGTIGGSTTVDLMMDVDTTFAGYQLDINFDNSIVDIPASGVTYVWGSGSTTNYGTYTRLVASSDDTVAGTYTLATLTLDGQSTPGISGLNFSGTLLADPNGDPLAHTATDGTYTIPAAIEPDLVVTNIDPSQAIFVDATNVFTVHVENQGTDDVTGSFDVYWAITDDASTILASDTETITGLNIGEEKTFDFNWEPTVLQNTSVSASADSGSSVAESDEINNDLSVTYVSGTGILPLSDWGYGGDEPLTNYSSGEVIGDLIYTFGDSAYLSGYNNPWSTYEVNFGLGSDVNQISEIVEGVDSGSVKEARLYMYYTWYRTPLGWPVDPEQKLTMTFDGNPISTDVKYEDSAGFGYYGDYKYGTFAYNVTSYVTGDGAYQAILTNDNTGDTHATGIYGMALLVIYEDGSKSLKEYHIAEGHDLLKQYYKSSSTGRYSYHVLPEDVTSTFNMPEATGGHTNLFTVAHAAASSPDKSRLYFNAEWWSDPWTTVFGSTGTDIVDVTLLNNNPNTVAFQDRGDGYSATNAILISDKSKPDLIVINIDPSQAIFVDTTNVFTVHVENQGTANVSGSFDVSWQITDDVSSILASGTGTITGLNTGEEKTFNFEWKPTVLQNTSVSATVDSGAVVAESDETNNDHSVTYVSGTGILPLSDWGYGGDEPLTNYKTGEVIGDLIYTFGDSAYLGGYNNPWSTYAVNFSLGSDINQINNAVEGVGSGTVQDARLYMYYTWYRTPLGWPADPEQKMTMAFDGNPISTDVKYEDSCGFGTYGDYKYGTFAYNVTSYVTGDGAYQAILTNDNTGDTHATGIYGMALLVIYEDGSKSLKEYHIAEGHDLLKQYYKSSSTGRYSYHVLPEDVTSTFNMPEATGGHTNLFTVAHAAASSPDKSRLYFNAEWWSDPWTTVFGSTGTDIVDVTLLNNNPNTVAFQDRGDGYSATNAILISEKEPNLVFAITPNSRIGQIGMPVTIFLSVINAGTATATDVSISQASSLPATISYQTWDGITLTGTPDTPVDIGSGETVNFVLTIDATSEFTSSAMIFNVSGTNSANAPVSGVNTLTMAASATSYADVIMMSTSLNVSTAVNTATAFALATTNVGTATATNVSLTVEIPSSITGLSYQVNETNSSDGSIKGPATGLTIPVGGNPTFAVFLIPTQAIDYDPANNRIMLKLVDGSGKVIGAQSVAVSTA